MQVRTFIVDGIDDMLRAERKAGSLLRALLETVVALWRTWRDAAEIMVNKIFFLVCFEVMIFLVRFELFSSPHTTQR